MEKREGREKGSEGWGQGWEGRIGGFLTQHFLILCRQIILIQYHVWKGGVEGKTIGVEAYSLRLLKLKRGQGGREGAIELASWL